MKLTYPQSGWDWFSVQLDNHHELMLYVIRNGEDEKKSLIGGSFILPGGKIMPVNASDVRIKTLDYWHSETTDSDYPSSWEITIKSLNLKIQCKPLMAEQEMNLEPMPYWEGAVSVTGTLNSRPVKGKGYVELVGYSRKYPMNYIN